MIDEIVTACGTLLLAVVGALTFEFLFNDNVITFFVFGVSCLLLLTILFFWVFAGGEK